MRGSPTVPTPKRKRRTAGFTAAIVFALLGGNAAIVATAGADASQDRMMNLPGGAIHVVTTGTPGPRAVVLIHGLAASSSGWDPILPAFEGRYVVRVDLLGHGRSAKPDTGYSIPEQATRVGEIPDRLGVDHRPEPERLTEIALPTMVLYGAQDHRWRPSSFEDYRQVPAVRIESLDCGHSPMLEDPDHTGPLLRDFADRH
ncbi:Haloalkane dehalogenase [Nocardia seriolae]|uniref:Haloalkane dehalogenase n=1 Tax=Nocardia seriolae TaxID=37332 RepID=A0ABC8AWK2_9NOCA|nr:alpha/beta fold hydrolase [Nocardia seriolae]APA98498.1 Haloalkane dehalogenase [Nocardia seriolae]